MKTRIKNLDQYIANQLKNPENLADYRRYKFVKTEFIDKVEISEADIKAYYNSNSSRFNLPEYNDIAIISCYYNAKNEKNKADAKKKIDTVLAELQKDSSKFAELAKKYSDCPSKTDGGRLGLISKGMLHKDLEASYLALEAGKFSDIIDLKNGYVIIYNYEKQPERKIQYDEVKPYILDMLQRKKAEENLGAFLQTEREKRKVELFIKRPAHVAPKFEVTEDGEQ